MNGYLLLRPHHALCIQKFVGRGYSPAFTAHLARVVRGLAAAPETPVRLAQGCDMICGVCPFYQGGVCKAFAKVAALDASVLSLCSLHGGQLLSWEDLARRAAQEILQTGHFAQICGCCQWYGLCSQIPTGASI